MLKEDRDIIDQLETIGGSLYRARAAISSIVYNVRSAAWKADAKTQNDLDAALARRDDANRPWDTALVQDGRLSRRQVEEAADRARSVDQTGGATMPLASDSAATVKAKQRELGWRERMVCVLPCDSSSEVALLFSRLESALVDAFGGYSVYNGKGGWRSKPDARAIHEFHRRYEVSYSIDNRSRSKALELFERVGERLGEDWLHIETSRVEAHHVKVTP